MIDRFERFSLDIFETTKHWHKIALGEMAQYGLKGMHAVYLIALNNHPDGITAAELSELSGRDKAEVSRSVSIMEKKGLVKREGVNKNHYRALLHLTDEGKKAAEFVCNKVQIAVKIAEEGISPEHLDIFYNVLEHIAANMQIMSDEGLPPR